MTSDHAVARLEIFPVVGIGELRPGDDLAAVITAHAPELHDGDVLVVTSKAVSKVEGRLITLETDDPEVREAARQAAIDAETVRVVARRGDLRIVQNRQGLVMAGAGVDASNIARNEIALLPVDPDASAGLLREALRERLGIDVAVIVSDTFGRPWRGGLTDVAIGVAGMSAVTDARGATDAYGNTLEMTTVAVADELAAAADLVKGKLGGVPVAVVRGMGPRLVDDGRGARDLVRDAESDMFRLGTAEAIALGRADVGWLADTTAPPLHGEAVSLVSDLVPSDHYERTVREAFLGFLASRPDAMWRSCAAGHLTASAVVVDPSSETVLLTLHPRVGAWLQLGGHCEPGDRTVLDAAAREAREESGIGSLSLDPTPIALDVHPVTCSLGVPTRHFDVLFLAVASPGAQPVISEESDDLRWWPWDELPDRVAANIPRLVRLARERLT